MNEKKDKVCNKYDPLKYYDYLVFISCLLSMFLFIAIFSKIEIFSDWDKIAMSKNAFLIIFMPQLIRFIAKLYYSKYLVDFFSVPYTVNNSQVDNIFRTELSDVLITKKNIVDMVKSLNLLTVKDSKILFTREVELRLVENNCDKSKFIVYPAINGYVILEKNENN